eukprot:scaffold99_cov160-Ochromonas_danica.AAC.5
MRQRRGTKLSSLVLLFSHGRVQRREVGGAQRGAQAKVKPRREKGSSTSTPAVSAPTLGRGLSTALFRVFKSSRRSSNLGGLQFFGRLLQRTKEGEGRRKVFLGSIEGVFGGRAATTTNDRTVTVGRVNVVVHFVGGSQRL